MEDETNGQSPLTARERAALDLFPPEVLRDLDDKRRPAPWQTCREEET